MVFNEPDRVKAHLIGQDALFERLFDHGMIVDDRPLHLIRQAESHATLHSKLKKNRRPAPAGMAYCSRAAPGTQHQHAWLPVHAPDDRAREERYPAGLWSRAKARRGRQAGVEGSRVRYVPHLFPLPRARGRSWPSAIQVACCAPSTLWLALHCRAM